MKIRFLALFFVVFSLHSQIKIVSWNLENFGKSKTEEEIIFVADILRDYDIVAIQEVVAGNGGAQAVAKLAEELNRKGAKWDYSISDPTQGTPQRSERYSFLWKPSSVSIKGKPWLDKKYEKEIEREPYLATFEYKNKLFTLATFHALPKTKIPEKEIKTLLFLIEEYPLLNIIFTGDFNLPQSHFVFESFREQNYRPVFVNQKTSLKQKCVDNECLASEYDNFFYDTSKVEIKNNGAIHFYKKTFSLKEARAISDHIPIWIEIF